MNDWPTLVSAKKKSKCALDQRGFKGLQPTHPHLRKRPNRPAFGVILCSKKKLHPPAEEKGDFHLGDWAGTTPLHRETWKLRHGGLGRGQGGGGKVGNGVPRAWLPRRRALTVAAASWRCSAVACTCAVRAAARAWSSSGRSAASQLMSRRPPSARGLARTRDGGSVEGSDETHTNLNII